jgi:transcriptional regulator with XRE-family HTH domain
MRAAPHPTDLRVGQQLRRRRTLVGMSQERLGALLGVTYQQIQKYERGANRVGSSRLHELARILEVPVGYFFPEPPEPVPAALHEGAEAFRFDGAPDVIPQRGETGLDRRETLELVRAFNRILDDEIRRRVVELTRALAAASMHGEAHGTRKA